MGDSQPISTRSALRRAGVGEIVEVQGGHIVRATGRKDRHSKVCTAKGPRDRRVRLSAHTAIQFYDVQDRLGYDRPSKAVDWLIKKAKAAIDELEQLPAWSPTNMNVSSSSKRRGRSAGQGGAGEEEVAVGAGQVSGGSDKHPQVQRHCEEQQQHNIYSNAHSSTFSLLPPSLDSDSIADTIKSFFPMGGPTHEVEAGTSITSSASTSPQLQFQEYPQGGLLPRSGNSSTRQSQDLRLSLQSFQDPILMHSHHQAAHAHDGQQSLFPGATSMGFDNPNVGWVQPNPEFGRLQRLMVGWNDDTGTEHHSAGGVSSSSGGGNSGGVGFMFNSQPLLQPLFSGHHSQFFTQREPLQSSNTPSIRAWNGDPSVASTSEHHQAISIHPQALSGIGFGSGGFSGFHIPTRIQGEEEHDGDPNKPSSASSGSRH